MACARCGQVHRYVPHEAEWARFLEEHRTRKQFDVEWANSLWHRTYPDDAFCILVMKGRAGFVPFPSKEK